MPVAPLILDSDLRIEVFPLRRPASSRVFSTCASPQLPTSFLSPFNARQVLCFAGHRYANGLQMLDLLRKRSAVANHVGVNLIDAGLELVNLLGEGL